MQDLRKAYLSKEQRQVLHSEVPQRALYGATGRVALGLIASLFEGRKKTKSGKSSGLGSVVVAAAAGAATTLLPDQVTLPQSIELGTKMTVNSSVQGQPLTLDPELAALSAGALTGLRRKLPTTRRRRASRSAASA